jgi:hypothetical protein
VEGAKREEMVVTRKVVERIIKTWRVNFRFHLAILSKKDEYFCGW